MFLNAKFFGHFILWLRIITLDTNYFILTFLPVIENQKENRRQKVKELIESLQQEDFNTLLLKLKEDNNKESPFLLAAEYGSYKILKSITELGDDIEKHQHDFTFDDCNEEGENILHLCKF